MEMGLGQISSWRRLHRGFSTCAGIVREVDVWGELGLFVTSSKRRTSGFDSTFFVCFYVSIVCCYVSDVFWGRGYVAPWVCGNVTATAMLKHKAAGQE